jgi:hypothetical protein
LLTDSRGKCAKIEFDGSEEDKALKTDMDKWSNAILPIAKFNSMIKRIPSNLVLPGQQLQLQRGVSSFLMI